MKELESSMELNDFMHMAIGQEIVNGRMENRHSRIHFLYYFAGREEWYDTIKDTAVYIIEGFCRKSFIFRFTMRMHSGFIFQSITEN